mmetsp:Transcript_37516/g.84627  ORF Transcript_37516/g.84627 Transcript_37516/m.84627 type:complete len:172 (+) Transcript_37516:66-581(+)
MVSGHREDRGESFRVMLPESPAGAESTGNKLALTDFTLDSPGRGRAFARHVPSDKSSSSISSRSESRCQSPEAAYFDPQQPSNQEPLGTVAPAAPQQPPGDWSGGAAPDMMLWPGELPLVPVPDYLRPWILAAAYQGKVPKVDAEGNLLPRRWRRGTRGGVKQGRGRLFDA